VISSEGGEGLLELFEVHAQAVIPALPTTPCAR
jgi:hypothetical protein